MTAEEKCREMLNDRHPEIQIGYLTFSPSRIVEELDPIAFRCMVADGEFEDDVDDSYDNYDHQPTRPMY